MPAGGALTAAAIAGPLIGGIIGASSARRGREQQAAAAQAAFEQLQAIGMPPDLSREVILKEFQKQGVLTPQLEQDINLQASQFGQIKEDPSLKAAQLQSLQMMGEAGRTGFTAADRAAYNEMNRGVQQANQANRLSILQQMQARGQGGSGAELLAQLQGSQGSADQASAQADRLAAQAAMNRLQANQQYGQMAGQVRGQDFSVAQQIAAAQDQRNQFLFQNSAAQQQRNVAQQNAVQQANLANAQRISESNTTQANTESLRQNQAKRQYFSDQLDLAGAKASALNGQGQIARANGQASADATSNLANAIGTGFGAAAKYVNDKPAATANPTDYVPVLDPNALKTNRIVT